MILRLSISLELSGAGGDESDGERPAQLVPADPPSNSRIKMFLNMIRDWILPWVGI